MVLLRSRAAIVAVVLLTVLFCTVITSAGASTARAADTEGVRSIRVDQPIGRNADATLVMTFDRPISSVEADDLRQRLGAPVSDTQTGFRMEVQQQPIDRLLCNQHLDRTDDNGYLVMQYQCLPKYSVTNWGFRISPDKQATVVGGVTERGWTWFRNGERQSLGAPHRVEPNYLFHGTMKPLHNGDVLDYQDYFTWRHNIGSGGTASLAIAGSLQVG